MRSRLSSLVLASSLCMTPIALADGMKHGDHKHSDHKMEAKHEHGTIEISKDQPIPAVKLIVTPDAISGWNMQLQLENFTFAPERVNAESKTTEGHAHLFLNGRKISRLYGTWYHIPSLPQGKNQLRVSLNTNKHEDLTYKGKPIDAMVIVEVPTSKPNSAKP
jgi:monoamine oxidase